MGWTEVALGDICEFRYGKSLKANERTGSGYPVYGSNGVVGLHGTALTRGPTIVVGRKGSFGEVHRSEGPCWPIDTTYFVDESATACDLVWLTYALRQLDLTALNRAAAVPGLNREDAYRKRLLLPPHGEQRRIAEVLDRANRLRDKRRGAMERLESLVGSFFVQIFGQPSSTTRQRVEHALGDHLLFVTSGGRGWARYYADHGSRFIRSLDVRMNSISDDDSVFVVPPNGAEARRTRVMCGDVLLTITGSRIGRVAALPDHLEGAYVSQHVAILRPDRETLSPRFLAFFLSSDSGGQRQIARSQYGQTKPGLNFEQIRSFQVPVPDLALQREFGRRVDQIDTLRSAHGASLRLLDSLFASLQHRAFSGAL